MLMVYLVRTPSRRGLQGDRAPDLKPSTTPDLQVAGLQEHATTPGRQLIQRATYLSMYIISMSTVTFL